MSATVQSICDAMEAWAPAALAFDWDRVGLQIGEARRPVERVLTCLTITSEVVARAEKWDAGMIVAHHPILFRPLNTLRTEDRHTRLCLRLASRNIACFAAHTNLDVVPGGVNTVLADDLGLREVEPLFPSPGAGQVKLVTFVPESHVAAVRTALSGAGAGEIGDYTECTFTTPGIGTFRPGAAANPYSGQVGALSEEAELRLETLLPRALVPAVLQALYRAHPYEEAAYDLVALENTDPRFGLGARGVLEKAMKLDAFAEHVRAALKLSHVRLVGTAGRKVRRVAVCGGSGGGEIARLPRDTDVYVTGDVKYHDADLARERGVAVIDAGHVGTERNIARHIARYLKQTVEGVEVKAVVEPELFTPVAGG